MWEIETRVILSKRRELKIAIAIWIGVIDIEDLQS